MRTIKFIAAAVMCLLSLTTNAQSTMRIEFESGKQVDYPVSSITSIKWFTNETTPDTPDISPSGAQAVDLGLSVKWANMNIGATCVEDFGDYFAWGEINTKTSYDWRTYEWCNGSYVTMTKYCTSQFCGTVDKKTTLDLSDDAARANWGGSWRMPTKAEQDELRTKCTWTLTTMNGVYGRKIVGPNGNFIFLPAAGYASEGLLKEAGSFGRYWSSSLSTSYSYEAYDLYFFSGSVNYYSNYRNIGLPVRAVCQ